MNFLPHCGRWDNFLGDLATLYALLNLSVSSAFFNINKIGWIGFDAMIIKLYLNIYNIFPFIHPFLFHREEVTWL